MIRNSKKTKIKKYSRKVYTRKTVVEAVSRRGRTKNSILPKLKKLFFKTFLRLIILALVAGVFILLFHAYNYAMSYLYTDERLVIEDIEVLGCNNVTETEIKNLIPFKVGDNMLKISLSDSKKKLCEQKTELKKISMSRKWNEKKIVISLLEREPEVFIFEGGIKTGLDFDNKPFPLRGNMFDMAIPVMSYSDDHEREVLLRFFEQFKKYMGDLISEITLLNFGEVEDIVFKINDKTTVYWGQLQYKKIKEKAEKIKLVLEDLNNKSMDAQYIDLTFIDNNKDRIIVKPSVENNVQEQNQEV